jgi:hypothetical protein
MAKRNGGIIGPSNVPTGQYGGTASGVWRLRDAFNYIKAGLWPVAGNYPVGNSLRFNSGSSDYLNRTPASNGNRKTWTWSGWVKRSTLVTLQPLFYNSNGATSNGHGGIYIENDNVLFVGTNDGASYTNAINTNAVLRDVSAWYHIVVVCDTTNATQANRQLIYINSVLQTVTVTQAITLNADLQINRNTETEIGALGYTGGASFLSGYLSEVNFIDGQALTPSSFGLTDSATGIWIPKAYSGTYGTNGFYLKFANSAALGTDSSGNGNTWTANNLTSVDQSTDTCTNNFATLNPLVNYQAYPPVLTEGNLKNTSNANGSNGGTSPSTIVFSQGKWYAEMKVGANIQNGTAFGIVTDSYRFDYQNDAAFYTSASFSSVAYVGDGRKVISNTFSSYGATFTTNDIIGIAVDLDNDTVTFYKNGSSQGSISTTLTGGYFICCYGYSSSVQEINFGSPTYAANSYTDANGFGNFSYAVPSGYYSLCTKNLAVYG